MTHKNRTEKNGLKPKKGDTESIPNNGMKQNSRKTEVSENSVNSAECLSHKNPITTKDLCSLQIQKQIKLNATENMTNDMYLNCMTEEEFDEKTESLLNLSFCKWLPYQKRVMKIIISQIKERGWFERFEYKDRLCAIELDDSGKWRIYVKPHPQDFLEFNASNFEFDYQTSSSRFGVENFELGLWWYGDKIGLDDFVGMQIFSYISWEQFFNKEKQKYLKRTECQITSKIYMKALCKRLVDCIEEYQVTVEKKKKWMCSICKIEYDNNVSTEQTKKQHEEFHKVATENVVAGEVFWEVLI
jgi:hypothetical protein